MWAVLGLLWIGWKPTFSLALASDTWKKSVQAWSQAAWYTLCSTHTLNILISHGICPWVVALLHLESFIPALRAVSRLNTLWRKTEYDGTLASGSSRFLCYSRVSQQQRCKVSCCGHFLLSTQECQICVSDQSIICNDFGFGRLLRFSIRNLELEMGPKMNDELQFSGWVECPANTSWQFSMQFSVGKQWSGHPCESYYINLLCWFKKVQTNRCCLKVANKLQLPLQVPLVSTVAFGKIGTNWNSVQRSRAE